MSESVKLERVGVAGSLLVGSLNVTRSTEAVLVVDHELGLLEKRFGDVVELSVKYDVVVVAVDASVDPVGGNELSRRSLRPFRSLTVLVVDS